jgi:hypothetical protein
MSSTLWIEYRNDDTRLQPAYPFVEHEEGYGWVLVWDGTQTRIACKVWDDDENNEWHWAADDGEWLDAITHWMPLPPPPM